MIKNGIKIVFFLFALANCFPKSEPQTVVAVDENRQQSIEKKNVNPDIVTSISNDIIKVKIEPRAECRTVSSTSTESAKSEGWVRCRSGAQLSSILVKLCINDYCVEEKTDSSGIVYFNLSDMDSHTTEPTKAVVEAAVEDQTATAYVPLQGTKFYSSWKFESKNKDKEAALKRIQESKNIKYSKILEEIEAELAILEKSKIPWSIDEVKKLGTIADRMVEIADDAPPKLSPIFKKISDRITKLEPLTRDVLAAIRKERAKKNEEAEKRALPRCMKCCFFGNKSATKEHCKAVCESDLGSYLANYGSDHVDGTEYPTGNTLLCKTPSNRLNIDQFSSIA